MESEELTGLEKIALAAFYWKHRGYEKYGFDIAQLIDAIEAHFGPSQNN